MIVIDLTQTVATNAELTALTGKVDQDIVYHSGEGSAFMFRTNLAETQGLLEADDNSGFWVKDSIDCLTLEQYKAYRFEEINYRSRELIAQGHIYASKLFSLSENAQRNLLGLFSARDFLTYPQEYRTKYDLDKVSLNDASDVSNFYFSAMGTIQTHLGTGNALKQQVKDAVDASAVASIIDNR